MFAAEDKRMFQASIAAGAISGVINDTIMHPVDTVRAQLQVTMDKKIPVSPFAAFRTMTARIVALDGVRGLYRGVSAVSMYCAPSYGLYFGAYYKASKSMEEWYGGAANVPAIGHFGAGLCAELAANISYIPYDVIRQNLQCNTNERHAQAPNAWELTRTLLRKGGVRALYPGVGATLCTYGPFSGVYFLCYETIKRDVFGGGGESDSPDNVQVLVNAVISGGVAATVTQPLDMLKTRIQTGRTFGAGKQTLLQTLSASISNARGFGMGWDVFFRGTVARVLTLAPACGITMTLYEAIRSGLA